jgi:mRNA-degrading endonuclease RelE of RelBE toxin-antitoxin system
MKQLRGALRMDGKEKLFNVSVGFAVSRKISFHCEFLANVSKSAARKLRNQFVDDINSLSFMPHHCPFYNHAGLEENKYHWLLSSKRYKIIYTIENDSVFVVDIQDCRQGL